MNLVESLAERTKLYRSVMIWTADMVTRGVPEHWRDDYTLFEEAVNKPFLDITVKCDCENFAMSLQHYAYKDLGIRSKDIKLFCVSSTGGDVLDHCVGGAVIDKVLCIFDNAQPRPFYSYARRPRDYRFLRVSCYDKPTQWNAIT